ncbi:MAG: RNA polymerase sigma factor [Mariniblastus sp.]
MNHYLSSITHMVPDLHVGDEVAWNKICDKFKVCLIHKARKLISGSNLSASLSSDDLVQESLLKAWNRIDKFRGNNTAQFTAWLFKIIRNTFLDWCKSPKLKASPNSTWFDFADSADSPSEILMDDELESRLYACLAELELQPQKVIMLRHFDGLKFSQIAERLEMNPNTAASHYRRGIEELQNQLGNKSSR